MTLEDRLERLATSTPPGDPADVLAAARHRVETGNRRRRRSARPLAAAVIAAVVALAAGVVASVAGEDTDAVTVAGPDRPVGSSSVDGEWLLTTTIRDGNRQPALAEVSITIESDVVTGTDGCGNDISTRLSDGRVASPVIATVDCFGRAGIAAQSGFVWEVLAEGPAYEVRDSELRDSELWLVTDGGDALVFVRTDRGDADRTGGVDGPVLYAPEAHANVMEEALLSGVLGREGDCLRLQPPPNVRDPIAELLLWPYGATWEHDPSGVRLLDGTFVPVGAQFTAAGGIHDIDSLAERGHHPDVVDRARACDAQNATSESAGVVAYVQGEFEVIGVPAPVEAVPTYNLDLAGASLVEDNPHTASNSDVALWSDGNGAYMSLTVRPGRPGSWATPGAGATVPDETFPEGQGEAWLSEPDDPSSATMWWVRPSGDLWLLNSYWYGDSVPESAEAALRDWALGIVHDPAANPPYRAEGADLTLVAYEEAGDRPSRSRVWEYDGEEIVLLVNERSSAAGPSNLLARGAPAVTDVPALGEVWSVATTYGWAVPGEDAWATLTVPDAIAERAPEILAALQPTRS